MPTSRGHAVYVTLSLSKRPAPLSQSKRGASRGFDKLSRAAPFALSPSKGQGDTRSRVSDGGHRSNRTGTVTVVALPSWVEAMKSTLYQRLTRKKGIPVGSFCSAVKSPGAA